MIKIVVPIISATTVSAIGHAMRWPFADFDIGCSTLGVERFCSDAIEQEQVHEQEQEESRERLCPKKLPPPTPDRREGRLFPPEQS
jgi:hypothetical protein